MAGRGPKPNDQRARSNEPARGEWSINPRVGWQHGELPKAPPKLLKASRDAWSTWMRSWFAAHWKPEDLPALRQLVRLYDQVERGEFTRHGELRLAMDTYGITPKGQQDRRWRPPSFVEPAEASDDAAEGSVSDRRNRLRVV